MWKRVKTPRLSGPSHLKPLFIKMVACEFDSILLISGRGRSLVSLSEAITGFILLARTAAMKSNVLQLVAEIADSILTVPHLAKV